MIVDSLANGEERQNMEWGGACFPTSEIIAAFGQAAKIRKRSQQQSWRRGHRRPSYLSASRSLIGRPECQVAWVAGMDSMDMDSMDYRQGAWKMSSPPMPRCVRLWYSNGLVSSAHR